MATPRGRAPDVALLIDLADKSATVAGDLTLAALGLHERSDLQRWISEHPGVIGPDLLLVTTEFDQWEIGEQRVADRLDILFLASDGALLVAELKRASAPEMTEFQALKYAAYCSTLTVDEVIEEFARYHDVPPDEAASQVHNHAPSLESEALRPIRVRIVATGFAHSVTTVVQWLYDRKLDIGCIELQVRGAGTDKALLTSRQIIPPPAAEDYMVRRGCPRMPLARLKSECQDAILSLGAGTANPL